MMTADEKKKNHGEEIAYAVRDIYHRPTQRPGRTRNIHTVRSCLCKDLPWFRISRHTNANN